VDSLDRSILTTLQREGRISNLALAQRFGLSPSAMLGRVRKLEQTQAIRGYRAVVDPAAVGVGVQAIVMARLRGHDQEGITTFEEAIQDAPGVRACYHVTGQFDMVLLVAVRDLDHLARLIRVDLAKIPGVLQFETMLVLNTCVADEGWPILEEEQKAGQ
jgi:Lrp/AsnC family transcriptional regulator, leucine-responsive regulatory protein